MRAAPAGRLRIAPRGCSSCAGGAGHAAGSPQPPAAPRRGDARERCCPLPGPPRLCPPARIPLDCPRRGGAGTPRPLRRASEARLAEPRGMRGGQRSLPPPEVSRCRSYRTRCPEQQVLRGALVPALGRTCRRVRPAAGPWGAQGRSVTKPRDRTRIDCPRQGQTLWPGFGPARTFLWYQARFSPTALKAASPEPSDSARSEPDALCGVICACLVAPLAWWWHLYLRCRVVARQDQSTLVASLL